MESSSIGLQSAIADGMDLLGMNDAAKNLRTQLSKDKKTLSK